MEKESPEEAESSGVVRSHVWLAESGEKQEGRTKSGSSSSSDDSGQETQSELSKKSKSGKPNQPAKWGSFILIL